MEFCAIIGYSKEEQAAFAAERGNQMAEEKIQAAKILLQNPYRQVMLQDYNKTLENHKFRKKIEAIENEISWFTGKNNQYKVEDRQGFFKHFQDNYAGKKHAPLGMMYRPLTSYNFGEEPELIYFMMLFVKADEELKQFQSEHPNRQEVMESDVLRVRYLKLRNEYRLLSALLDSLDKAVGAIDITIAEHFVTDFTKNMDKLNPSQLNSRFFRALRAQRTDQCFELLELLKEKNAPDTEYMELLAHYNAKNFEKLVELAEKFPKDDKNYQPVTVLRTEVQARMGNIPGFIESFNAIGEDVIDTVHFLFLLQELITHAKYSELDTDEFDTSIQELLKSKFKQVETSTFAGTVSRNFVNYLLEGLPIAEELAAIKKEKGEDAIPKDRLERLYQLQMALDLYPNEDVSSLIDIEKIEENGSAQSRERIGRLAMSLLLEKSKEKNFENIYLAFQALARMGLQNAFVSNVENNLQALVQFGRSGQSRAYALIKAAYMTKKNANQDVTELEKALTDNGISLEETE